MSYLDIRYTFIYHIDMVKSQIYLEPQQVNFLRQVARQKKSTMSDIIRDLINEKIPNSQIQKNSGQWALELAQKAEKMKVKGPSDLATNPDKYLYV